MSEEESGIDVNCDLCKKSFSKEAILKHIGKNKACKEFYGPRFKEMKKEKERNRKAKNRAKLSLKDHNKLLKRQRIKYAQDPELKEKKKEWNKAWKEKNEMEKQERASKRFEELETNENPEEFEEESGIMILLRSSDNLSKIFKEPLVKCQFCMFDFEPSTILKHISKEKNCKSFYGEKFDFFKMEQKKLTLKSYQLAKRREAYASDPALREKKKMASKKANTLLKQKKEAKKAEWWKNSEIEGAQRSLVLGEKESRQRNLEGRERMDWLKKCLGHFFETFSNIDSQIKDRILAIEVKIDELYNKNESEIDEKVKEIKDNGNKGSRHFRTWHPNNIQYRYWKKLDWQIADDMEKIVSEIEEQDKNSDWIHVLEAIQENFKSRYSGWQGMIKDSFDHYSPPKACIICNLKPNCLDPREKKDKNTSKCKNKKSKK